VLKLAEIRFVNVYEFSTLIRTHLIRTRDAMQLICLMIQMQLLRLILVILIMRLYLKNYHFSTTTKFFIVMHNAGVLSS